MTARRRFPRRRSGWPHTFEHARWIDRLGYIRARFEAGGDIELLPGELSARLRLIGAARRAFGPMEDVSHDGPWASRIRDHDLLAVYRDGRGRLWCLFYTAGGGVTDENQGAVILEHVTPADLELE
jgi:hypothetical protein